MLNEHDTVIEMMIDYGYKADELIIVSSFPSHLDTPVYVSKHGGIEVVFDPMLSPKQLAIMSKKDYRPTGINEL